MCLEAMRPYDSRDRQSVVVSYSFHSISSPFASLKRKPLFVSSKRK
jgi:hypothetical protein